MPDYMNLGFFVNLVLVALVAYVLTGWALWSYRRLQSWRQWRLAPEGERNLKLRPIPSLRVMQIQTVGFSLYWVMVLVLLYYSISL